MNYQEDLLGKTIGLGAMVPPTGKVFHVKLQGSISLRFMILGAELSPIGPLSDRRPVTSFAYCARHVY